MSATSTITFTDTLTIVECYKCGISFGMPVLFNKKRLEDKETFYCPNGHGQAYTKSTSQKLQAELDQIKADRDFWSRRASDRLKDIENEKRRHAATKGQLTKTRKRAIAGTCPCCSRSFVDVRRHMANKHPDEAVVGLGDGKAEVTE